MNKDIAEQLKYYGFPLINVTKSYAVCQTGKRNFCMMCGFPFLEIRGEYFLQPLLEVLIEACGKDFVKLEQGVNFLNKKSWFAYADEGSGMIGNSPEEAVAKLWLNLNKKHHE